MTTIAIIGAGFSGTLLSLHLLRHCPPPTRLILIERSSQFGRGLAYATGTDSHILNVPAARMSAFHDRPSDFLDWLTRQPDSKCGGTPAGPQTFAPRRLFGAYVRALLNDEIKRSGRDRLELVKGDVIGLDRTADPMVLTLDRGRSVQADMAVLAIGNFPPEPMPIANPGFYDTAFYRSLIASHFASSFLPARGFSVRLKRRFPAPAIHLPDIARSVGQDLARQRQPRSGLVLTEASTVSRSSGWRLLSLPDHGSFRGLTRQPQHGIGEGGTSMSRTRSSEGAATKEARLPGLVPAGTCSRLGQADLLSLTIEPDLFILPPPKRRPSRSRNRPARRDA